MRSGWGPAARILVSIAAGLLLGLLISEVTYRFNSDGTDRSPQRIELVIPAGTAAQVAAGVPVDTLPREMVFVEGDTLVVKNEDTTSHQLGPVWVPPQSTGSLVLDRADRYSYSCSFQPTRFIGLDVRPTVTTGSRIQAMLVLGLPLGGLIAVYSFLLGMKSQKEVVPGTLPE